MEEKTLREVCELVGVTRRAVDMDYRPELMSRLNSAIIEINEQNPIKIDNLKYIAYTKSIDYTRDIGYYVDNGKSVNKDNLYFKYLSLKDNTLTDIDLVEKEKTKGAQRTKYITLDNIPAPGGIVIQSLYDTDGKRVYPLRYYRPCFISLEQSRVDDDTRKHRKAKRLCGCVKSLEDCITEDTFKHFNVACKCGCYFSSLDRLLALTYTPSCMSSGECKVWKSKKECEIIPVGKSLPNILSKEEKMAIFYIGYCDYCAKENIAINYSELWRMAEELCCDWLLIPRHVWKMATKDDEVNKQRIINLLQHRPIESYKTLLDNYWNLNWTTRRGVKSAEQRVAYDFMKYILAEKDDKRPASLPSRESVVREIEILNKA